MFRGQNDDGINSYQYSFNGDWNQFTTNQPRSLSIEVNAAEMVSNAQSIVNVAYEVEKMTNTER